MSVFYSQFINLFLQKKIRKKKNRKKNRKKTYMVDPYSTGVYYNDYFSGFFTIYKPIF